MRGNMSQVTEKKSLTMREKAAFGIGAFGKDICYMLSATYVLYYFQDVLGVKAAVMGVILLVARIFDALNDPLMGIVTAKTRTRWGKFRPWIFLGSIINGVILYVMFSAPPSLSPGGLVAYAATFYILWGVTYTMMDIPFWSMIPAFTKGGKEREGLSQFGRICSAVGQALIIIFAMMSVTRLGTLASHSNTPDERLGFKYFALIIAVVFVICEMITSIFIKEKSTVEVKTNSVGQMFKSLFRNDQAMWIVLSTVIVNMAYGITSNLITYFIKYDMGNKDWSRDLLVYNAFGAIMQIVFMSLVFPLLRKRFNTRNIFYISIITGVVGFALLCLLPYLTHSRSVYILTAPAILIFVSQGFLNILNTIFLADTCDYAEWKTGTRDESVIFSMQTFVVKLGSGIAALVASLTLAVNHIQKNATGSLVLSASSINGLRISMTIVPMVFLLIALWIFAKKYILTDKKLKQINDDLDERHAAASEKGDAPIESKITEEV